MLERVHLDHVGGLPLIGLRGASFTFLKFRSMRVQSAADIHKRYTADWIYVETSALEQDVRIVLKTIPALLFGKAY